MAPIATQATQKLGSSRAAILGTLTLFLTSSFISEVWVAFHKVDSGHRKDMAASHRKCQHGKVVMVLGTFR